jgi:hypothetical protein
VIGGPAVVLAPRYLPKVPLRKLRRSLQTLAGKHDKPLRKCLARRSRRPQAPEAELSGLSAGASESDAQPGSLRGFAISRALAKTITFRVIASTMDFATNYFVVRHVGSSPPPASSSGRSSITATRRPGNISARRDTTSSFRRSRHCRPRGHLLDFTGGFSPPGNTR